MYWGIAEHYTRQCSLTRSYCYCCQQTFQVVCSRLSLAVIIALSPDRPNLMLTFVEKPTIDNYCKYLSLDLKLRRTEYLKSIFFCHRHQDVSEMYASLIQNLGNDKTEPPAYPNLLRYWLVTMYSRATTTKMKEKDNFCPAAQTCSTHCNSYHCFQYGVRLPWRASDSTLGSNIWHWTLCTEGQAKMGSHQWLFWCIIYCCDNCALSCECSVCTS